MTQPVKQVLVYPRPGVKVFLPGGVHGFTSGPVPMHPDHAEALAAHVMTEDEKAAIENEQKAKVALAAAQAQERAARAEA